MYDSLVLRFAKRERGEHDPLDSRNHIIGSKPWTRAFANSGTLGAVTAKRYLVVFDTSPIEAQYTNMPHVVMPTRIYAA